MSFDTSLFNLFHSLAGKNTFLDIIVVIFAEYFPYIVILGIVVGVLAKKDSRARFHEIILIGLSAILARGILTTLIKFIVDRPRPYIALSFTPLITSPDSAFPSGHATFFFAVAMAVWYLNRRWGNWLFLSAILIGLARVVAGVHWPLDILAGALIGVISAIIVRSLIPYPKKASSTSV